MMHGKALGGEGRLHSLAKREGRFPVMLTILNTSPTSAQPYGTIRTLALTVPRNVLRYCWGLVPVKVWKWIRSISRVRNPVITATRAIGSSASSRMAR